jgi:methyl-accepting chemotaxis protein
MSAVKKHLQELPSTDVLVRVVARIDAAYETTLLHRSEVDQDIHKLGLQRGAHTDFRAFQVSTALISGLQELLRAIHAELRTTDPTIAAWLEVQELSLEMAEHAGRERALIAVFLSAAGKTANARLGPAEYNRDKVFRIWAQIRSSLAALAPPQRMTEQASLVEQRYFSPHSQMRRILLSPQPNGQPLSALEWFQQATLGIDAMIDFSREAGATAAQGPSRNT